MKQSEYRESVRIAHIDFCEKLAKQYERNVAYARSIGFPVALLALPPALANAPTEWDRNWAFCSVCGEASEYIVHNEGRCSQHKRR